MAEIPDYRKLPQRKIDFSTPSTSLPPLPDFGGQAQEQLKKQIDRTNLREEAAAKTAFYLAKTKMDGQVDEDQDYTTLADRYSQSLEDRKSETLSGVSSAYVRQALSNEFDLSIAESVAKVHDIAEVRRKDHELAQFHQTSEELGRSTYTGVTSPLEAFSAYDTALAAQVADDNMTDVQAQDHKRKFRQSTLIGHAENLDPSRAEKEITRPLFTQNLDGDQIAALRNNIRIRKRQAREDYLRAKGPAFGLSVADQVNRKEISREQGVAILTAAGDSEMASHALTAFNSAVNAMDSARAADAAFQVSEAINQVRSGGADDVTQTPNFQSMSAEAQNAALTWQESRTRKIAYNSVAQQEIGYAYRNGDILAAAAAQAKYRGQLSGEQEEGLNTFIASGKVPDEYNYTIDATTLSKTADLLPEEKRSSLYPTLRQISRKYAEQGRIPTQQDKEADLWEAYAKVDKEDVPIEDAPWYRANRSFEDLDPTFGPLAVRLTVKQNDHVPGTEEFWRAVGQMHDQLVACNGDPNCLSSRAAAEREKQREAQRKQQAEQALATPVAVPPQQRAPTKPILSFDEQVAKLKQEQPEEYQRITTELERTTRPGTPISAERIWRAYEKKPVRDQFGQTWQQYKESDLWKTQADIIKSTADLLNDPGKSYRDVFVAQFGDKFPAHSLPDLKNSYPDQYEDLRLYVRSHSSSKLAGDIDRRIWEKYTDMADESGNP